MLEVLLLRIRWIVREQEVEMTADDGGVVSFGVFHHHANVCLPSALFEHVFRGGDFAPIDPSNYITASYWFLSFHRTNNFN